MRLGVWGIGARTEKYLKFGYFGDAKICLFVDKYRNGEKFHGLDVISPNELPQKMNDIDYLIVSTHYCGEILGILWDLSIDKKKVIFTEFITEKFYDQSLEMIKQLFPKLYEDVRMRRIHLICENERDDFDDQKIIGTRGYDSVDYLLDYYRYRTFEFVGDEIIKNNVEGELAELGVFRGVFSSLISRKCPDKDIYLFDTFEGFDTQEAEKEKKLGRSNDEFEFQHTLTNEMMAINNMPHQSKCHICKGLFPETVTDEIEQLSFAFVSIDVDFEESMYEGLEFFYPRLSKGGYMFIHDYNSQYLVGVKKAVTRYEEAIQCSLTKVPIADRAGTLIIAK